MSLRDIHTPVLLDRCVELLAPALEREGAVFVDATLGMGGHSEAFLERFPGIHLVGLDRDQDALRIAGERLAPYEDRITLVHTVYDGIAAAVESAGFDAPDGILFDLGVSSLQLDVADRGFAYSQDAPLDMRMDQTTGPMASYILQTYSEGELRRIFERYGEEKLSGRYARAIIKARESEPIERSGQLVEILIAATREARAILTRAGEVNFLSGPGRGVILIKLSAKEDRVLGFIASSGDRDLMTVETTRGAEQTISTTKYEITGRGGKGRELLQRGQFTKVVPVVPDAPEPLS